MGSLLSTHSKTKQCIKESREYERHGPQTKSGQPAPGPDFLHPYRDPESADDNYPFPLEGHDIALMSEKELLHIYSTAPRVHHYGEVKITRISKSLVIKGGLGVVGSEWENMVFASEILHLPVPKVHRTFKAKIPDISRIKLVEGHFIVMDYIAGPTLESCWNLLDRDSQESVAQQVASMIEQMQSRRLNNLPPGPLGRSKDQKFEGPWFTDDGAGPFETLEELEAWCNHKIDVCAMVFQLPVGTPKFRFQDLVFTHQDIAPRNLIVDINKKVWLIDWGCAGVYPLGFEQAVLREQSGNDEFVDMVMARLSNQQKDITKQYAAIGYGLSTGRML